MSFSYDAAHRLTAIADSAGNRVGYSIDLVGQLSAMSSGGDVEALHKRYALAMTPDYANLTGSALIQGSIQAQKVDVLAMTNNVTSASVSTGAFGVGGRALGERVLGGALAGGFRGIGGSLHGIGIGAGLGALAAICQPSERDLCERECDHEYDRGRDFCRAMSGMQGRNKEVFATCMRKVDERYVECYQECARK